MKKDLQILSKKLREVTGKEIKVMYGKKQEAKGEFSVTLFSINEDIRRTVKYNFLQYGSLIEVIKNYNGIESMIKYVYKINR